MTARATSAAAAVVAALLMSACTHAHSPSRSSSERPPSSSTTVVPGGTTTIRLGRGATVRIPRQWITTPFQGMPATVYFPSLFVSSAPMPVPCRRGPSTQTSCQENNWFPPTWTTPRDGVVVMWAQAQYPGTTGPALSVLPGRTVTIARHRARLYSGAATIDCPDGTDREIAAWVQAYGRDRPGERWDMRACFGPQSATGDRASVASMLASLRVRRSST